MHALSPQSLPPGVILKVGEHFWGGAWLSVGEGLWRFYLPWVQSTLSPGNLPGCCRNCDKKKSFWNWVSVNFSFSFPPVKNLDFSSTEGTNTSLIYQFRKHTWVFVHVYSHQHSTVGEYQSKGCCHVRISEVMHSDLTASLLNSFLNFKIIITFSRFVTASLLACWIFSYWISILNSSPVFF